DDRLIGSVTIESGRQIVTITKTVTSKKVTAKPKIVAPEPAPATEPATEPESLPVTLSDAALKQARAAAEQAAKQCGQESLAPSVKVEFVVASSGKVSSASALAPMKGTSVGTCVATAVAAIRFPKSQAGVSKTWTLPLSD